jgi:hypothetical protein
MNNKTLIITGLVIFLIIVLFPFWYMRGKAAPAPEPVRVRSTEYMRSEHMLLLDVWRDSVVRDGNRIYVNPEGKEFNMSLSNTCLDCHSNKAEFCDRCHNYASVRPYCWSCHIENPKEKT